MVLQLVLGGPCCRAGRAGNHHIPLCFGSGFGAEGPGIHGPPHQQPGPLQPLPLTHSSPQAATSACSKGVIALSILLLLQCTVPYGSVPSVNYGFFSYLNKMIC